MVLKIGGRWSIGLHSIALFCISSTLRLCWRLSRTSSLRFRVSLFVFRLQFVVPLQCVLAFLLWDSPVILGLSSIFFSVYPSLNLLKSNQKSWITVNDSRFFLLVDYVIKNLVSLSSVFWFSYFGKYFNPECTHSESNRKARFFLLLRATKTFQFYLRNRKTMDCLHFVGEKS